MWTKNLKPKVLNNGQISKIFMSQEKKKNTEDNLIVKTSTAITYLGNRNEKLVGGRQQGRSAFL